MRIATERVRNGGIACLVVGVTVGAVLAVAWIVGLVDRASQVDALKRQLRARPTVTVSGSPAATPAPGSTAPGVSAGPQPGQPNPALVAAVAPPTVPVPAPTGSGGGTLPPPPRPRPSPPPTPTPPTARSCTIAVTLRLAGTSACVAAVVTAGVAP